MNTKPNKTNSHIEGTGPISKVKPILGYQVKPNKRLKPNIKIKNTQIEAIGPMYWIKQTTSTIRNNSMANNMHALISFLFNNIVNIGTRI